ncbi:hypothetical protein [Pseudoalteromonas sp.]|uniref:hypothetical protein n=1 Tax=Pseudoalteromonas sp. TaxID=53249 RepID=UPI0026095FCF|nr:hypothetical protein [Pseudoalteromonas sp.]MCP4585304.1 hypothetical protein [Pseudoalteromonas sp.]
MAASNYMTKADTESIWDTSLDTTRFGKIGVRIAEQLNFWCNDNATSQVTNTAVTPVLEQISEEILLELIATAKIEQLVNPWTFVQANVVRITWRILENYGYILKKIQRILGNSGMELVRKTLPSSTTGW